MKKISGEIDVLHDDPYSCTVKMGVPLLITYFINLIVTMSQQKIYAAYAGEQYFLVTGVLNGIFSTVPNIYLAVASSAWIKTAGQIIAGDEDGRKQAMIDGLYANIVSCSLLSAVMILFSDVILNWIHVPAESMAVTKSFYTLTILLHILTAISSYMLSVVNGISNVTIIFIVNCINVLLPLPCAYLVLAVLRMGIDGAAVLGGVVRIVVIIMGAVVIRKKGLKKFSSQNLKLRWRHIGEISKYGGMLALQTVFCFIGSVILGVQSNRYLPQEYLAVLSVSLPMTGVMSIFGRIIHTMIPVNYERGNRKRVKQILTACLVMCLGYSLICFAVYTFWGKPYFSGLFDSNEMIEYGISYWFWYGLGFIPLAVIFVLRLFFESIGKSKTALFSGVFEMLGMLCCAVWLIPKYGTIGRSLGSTLGWTFAAIYLIIVYLARRKRMMS